MANSIGQYTAVFLPGEPRSLTEKPGRPQSTGLQSRTLPKQPCGHRCKTFLACGSSAPGRVECEGGAAAWLSGTLAAPSVQGHGLPPPQSYGPIRVFIPASCSWRSEGLFGQSLSVAPPVQALRGLPCLGSFSVVWRLRHIEGHPRLGSYSVDWRVSHLKGHPVRGPTL